MSAAEYRHHSRHLLHVALDSLEALRACYDVVICEGAGSPAEINLRDSDIANMGLARAAGLPVIVAGDIDRGGVFAALYGTLALLSPADQALVSGFVINKFRGDPGLLAPGLDMITGLTGRPVLGVLPWAEGLALDMEDSLTLDAAGGLGAAGGRGALGNEVLRVSVVRTPRISNVTDLDALAAEPGVLVRFAASPAELADADLVVLPGSRATVADLGWLRERGLAEAITGRARAGRPVLGICGGYQMLGTEIEDRVESRAGTVAGLGLLPVRVTFGPHKVLGRPRGTGYGAEVTGYEIHHGVAAVAEGAADPVPGRLPVGGRVGHHLARHAGVRRIPAGVPHRGRGPGRAGLRRRPGHQFRRRPAGPAGHPGRPGGRAPGHRGAGPPHHRGTAAGPAGCPPSGCLPKRDHTRLTGRRRWRHGGDGHADP